MKGINKSFKKQFTKDGKDWKEHINQKVIYEHKTLILTGNCYASILPHFKS